MTEPKHTTEPVQPAVVGLLETPVRQHTPGPWNSPGRIHGMRYIEARIGGGWVQEIAACGPTEVMEQQEANVRLISAAPDLFDALDRLSQQCARMRLPGQSKSDAEKNAEEVLSRAGAA